MYINPVYESYTINCIKLQGHFIFCTATDAFDRIMLPTTFLNNVPEEYLITFYIEYISSISLESNHLLFQ